MSTERAVRLPEPDGVVFEGVASYGHGKFVCRLCGFATHNPAAIRGHIRDPYAESQTGIVLSHGMNDLDLHFGVRYPSHVDKPGWLPSWWSM